MFQARKICFRTSVSEAVVEGDEETKEIEEIQEQEEERDAGCRGGIQ